MFRSRLNGAGSLFTRLEISQKNTELWAGVAVPFGPVYRSDDHVAVPPEETIRMVYGLGVDLFSIESHN